MSKIFFYLFLLFTLCLQASIPSVVSSAEQERFTEERVRKGKIQLSEILGAETAKSIRLKSTAAIRFDAHYKPMDGGKPVDLPAAEILRRVHRANKIFDTIREHKLFTTVLNGKDVALPLGITKKVGNKEVIICLDSIVFTAAYAYAVVYAIIEDTKNNKRLAFCGTDIRFTRDGGFTGDARLELLQTYHLQFGPNVTTSFLVDRSHENYLVFDCNGFKHVHVDTKVNFSREIFIPELPDGSLDMDTSHTVSSGFIADFTSFDDWLVELRSLNLFQIKGLEGFSFNVSNLVFDRSVIQNSPSLKFPLGYSPVETGVMWEGIYMKDVGIVLPEELNKKSSNNRISVFIQDAVIDKQGFSGKASATNLFPLSDGDMSGWQYSLDYLEVQVLKNTPVGAGFRGMLQVPINKSDEQFQYNALIQPGRQFNFSVTTKSNLSFPLWGASDVTLTPDSWVEVKVIGKKFVPVALLNGKMSITATINGKDNDNNTKDKGTNLSLLEISFQRLRIQTATPYLSIDKDGGVKFGSEKLEQKLARLPISITEAGFASAGSDIGILFKVNINLAGEKDAGGGFAGSATLTIWGTPGRSSYTFKKLQLNRVDIKTVQVANVKLSGFIDFFRDDASYGSGFSGAILCKIATGKGDTIGLDAKAIFGKDLKSGSEDIYRYFGVDMLVRIPKAPVVPPLLYLNAFGGGFFYHMAMQTGRPAEGAKFVSNSGVMYVANESKSLGLKAMMGVQGEDRRLYDGQLIFEIEFNDIFGLSKICFSGYVQVASLALGDQYSNLQTSMSGFVNEINSAGEKTIMDNTPPANGDQVNAQIQKMAEGGAMLAQWRLIYAADKKTFSGTIDYFTNIPPIIVGTHGNGGLSGVVDILITPKEWHIFAGTPGRMMGNKLLETYTIGQYFMMGMNMPPPLPMPNGHRADLPSVPANGMAMGVRLHSETGGGDPFYYKGSVDVGFDIAIWNVTGQYCGSKPKGVKGWYGAGQAFVLGGAEGGFKDCWSAPYPCNWGWHCGCGKKRCWIYCPQICYTDICIDIGRKFDIGIDATIQAPNPMYFEGRLNVFGFEVTVRGGKRC